MIPSILHTRPFDSVAEAEEGFALLADPSEAEAAHAIASNTLPAHPGQGRGQQDNPSGPEQPMKTLNSENSPWIHGSPRPRSD